jgi:hypothetical protein
VCSDPDQTALIGVNGTAQIGRWPGLAIGAKIPVFEHFPKRGFEP